MPEPRELTHSPPDAAAAPDLRATLERWALNEHVALRAFEESELDGLVDQGHPIMQRYISAATQRRFAQRQLADRLSVDIEAIRVDLAPGADLPTIDEIDRDLAKARRVRVAAHQASRRAHLRMMARDPAYRRSPSMKRMNRRETRYCASFRPPYEPPMSVIAPQRTSTRSRGAGRPRAARAVARASSGDSDSSGSNEGEPPEPWPHPPTALVPKRRLQSWLDAKRGELQGSLEHTAAIERAAA